MSMHVALGYCSIMVPIIPCKYLPVFTTKSSVGLLPRSRFMYLRFLTEVNLLFSELVMPNNVNFPLNGIFLMNLLFFLHRNII